MSFIPGAGSGGAAAAFGWLQNLTALAALNAWATIAFASARMTQAFKAQGISRDSLPMRAPFSPWFQYFSSGFCAIIIVFSGFSVFLNGNWSTADFFANYISASVKPVCTSKVTSTNYALPCRSVPLCCPIHRLQVHQEDQGEWHGGRVGTPCRDSDFVACQSFSSSEASTQTSSRADSSLAKNSRRHRARAWSVGHSTACFRFRE